MQEYLTRMKRLLKTTLLIAALALTLAACAPDDLDITPSPTPTETPVPTNTPAPTPTPNSEATEAAAPAEGEAASADGGITVETVAAALPGTIDAGVSWRLNNEVSPNPVFDDVEGGRMVTAKYREPGGSLAEISVGLFDTPEAAQTFYDAYVARTRTLQNAEPFENFPMPNLFGIVGLYGSTSVFLQGDMFVRVYLPQVSGTLENPLPTLSRRVFRILESEGLYTPAA